METALLASGANAPVKIPPIARPTVFMASRRFNPSSVVLEKEVCREAGAKPLALEAIKATTERVVIRTIFLEF